MAAKRGRLSYHAVSIECIGRRPSRDKSRARGARLYHCSRATVRTQARCMRAHVGALYKFGSRPPIIELQKIELAHQLPAAAARFN